LTLPFADRPISGPEEDALERDRFVTRFMDAIIDTKSRRSTGVIVGITGPWGSGKSSVLQLLSKKILLSYPTAIVFRFDPWLVRGRDELLTFFFRDFTAQLESRSEDRRDLRKLAASIAKYADALSSIAKEANSTAGGGLSFASWLLKLFSDEDDTLEGLKTRLRFQLNNVRAPIVILIDELDRVEDDEVRAVAQLVRAILDLPRISYVLAYDNDRVVEALGFAPSLSRKERKDRGRAYLEKIVQHSIALPISNKSVLRRLFNTEIDNLIAAGVPLEKDDPENRYNSIIDILFDGIVETLRDIKRIVGQFRILESMTRDEVDTIDVLGFAALSAKRSDVVDVLKGDPDAFVDDPDYSHRRAARHYNKSKENHPVVAGLPNALQELFVLLFPRASASRTTGRAYGLPISKHRPLLTLLQLGLLPEDLPRSEIENFIRASRLEVRSTLEAKLADETLSIWMDRVSEIYPMMSGIDSTGFWLGATDFFRNRPVEPSGNFLFTRGLVDTFAALLRTKEKVRGSNGPETQNVIERLLRAGDVNIAADVLRMHIFVYGLFDKPNTGRSGGYISQDTVESWALRYAATWRRQLLKGTLLNRLSTLDALFIIVDLNLWDDEVRAAVWEKISANRKNFDRVILLMFGGNHLVESVFLDRLLGASRFRELARVRLGELGIDADQFSGTEALTDFGGDVFLAAALLRSLRGIGA